MADIVKQMLEAAHHLAALGLSPGSTGNISCRVAETFHMSASGTHMASLEREQLATYARGEWSGPKPTKEFPLHMALYERNPEATCVIHLHSPRAAAASCLDPWSEYCALPPLSPYFVMRVGNLPLIPYRHPGSVELGDLLRESAHPFDCALLANHGVVAAGSVSQAVERCIEIENSSGLLLQLAGFSPHTLGEQECLELAERNARPWGHRDNRLP